MLARGPRQAGGEEMSSTKLAFGFFASALDSSPMALRRDDCGDYRINGRHLSDAERHRLSLIGGFAAQNAPQAAYWHGRAPQ
jgi:hypothetical protein